MSSKKKIHHGGAREAAFTDGEVRQIRKLSASGKSISEIAEKFGARYDTTKRVVKGLSYRHLLEESDKKPAKAKAAKKVKAPKTLAPAKPKKSEAKAAEPKPEPAPKKVKTERSEFSEVKAGDRIVDCDPRHQREGLVDSVLTDKVFVTWPSGKGTFVARRFLHRKTGVKKGYRILSASEESVERVAEPAPSNETPAERPAETPVDPSSETPAEAGAAAAG